MPLSKTNTKAASKSPGRGVVKEDGPLQRVLEYTPAKFDLGISTPARDFQTLRRERQNDFRMADVLRTQTGINEIEAKQKDEEIEQRTLEKLKDIQESAFQEAYNLGLAEGKKEAYENATTIIDANLQKFGLLITAIENLKKELFQQNESHILKLVLHVATRLAQREVEVNNECVVDIMRNAIESAQLDEEVAVQVAPRQYDFLEKLKKETGRNYDFLKKVKLMPMDSIANGGCVIETNYGIIDARFEERISKLWETMSENLYRIKDKVGAA